MVPKGHGEGSQWQRPSGRGQAGSEMHLGCGEVEEEGLSSLGHHRIRYWGLMGGEGGKGVAGGRLDPKACCAGQACPGLNLCGSPRASSSQGSWGPLCHPHSEPSRATTPASAPAVATDRPVPAPWAPTWPDMGSVALRPPEGTSRACTGSHPAALPLGAFVGTRPRGDTAFLGLLGPRGYHRGL